MTIVPTDLQASDIRIAAIAGKGRGVVAGRAILAGTRVAADVAVELAGADCDRLEATALGDFYFAHPDDPERGCLVFGPLSFVNHAELPNARVVWRQAPGIGWVAELHTLRDIPAGEELTHRYRCGPWFPVTR